MLDLSTPTLRPSESPSLLGTTDGTLALRVCGGAHRGRVIQIRSPKCTIGSAVGCTLRLRAIGVRPLHCWILRGPSGTVVRRRCAGSLLNGQAYEDAPLAMGDRLRVGTVELEVVECQHSSPPVMSTVTQRFADEPLADKPRLENREKVRELETLLTAAHEEIARLEADAQQAWQTSITAAERAEQLRVALERANVESGEVRGELEAAQAALENERQQVRPELESLRQQLTDVQEELSANVETLGRSNRELAEQSARFATEREALEGQIKQAHSELEQSRARFGQQASQMTITMDQVRAATQAAASEDWESRYSALDGELQETRHELAAARKERDAADEWRSKYLEADRQVERWQAEADSRRTQIEALQSQLAELKARQSAAAEDAGQQAADQRQELERTRHELDQQRQQLDAKQLQLTELQEQLSAQRLELEALREQFEQQSSELRARFEELATREEKINEAHRGLVEFEEELKRGREALDAERAAQQSALDDQAARLQQQTDLLAKQVNELAVRQAEMDQARERLAQAEADLESRQEAFITQEAELEAGRVAFEADRAEFDRQRASAGEGLEDSPQRTLVGDFSVFAADSQEAEAANCPDEPDESSDLEVVDSVLSRLVQSGVWRGDQAKVSDDEVANESLAEDRAKYQEKWEAAADDFSAPAAAVPVPAANVPTIVGSAETSDEESIEKYMERLMQRVRGDSTSGPRPPLAAVFQAAAEQARPAQPLPAPEADNPQPVKPEDYVPRSQAPEQSQNLAAMRELANSAARSAIEKHHQKSHGKQAAGRLLGAGILLLGSALLGYWAWHTHSLLAAIAAGIGLLCGTLWALRGFGRLLNSLKLSRPPAAPADAFVHDETPQAAPLDDAVPVEVVPLDPATLEAAPPAVLEAAQPAASEELLSS